jgi:hypothetical protein
MQSKRDFLVNRHKDNIKLNIVVVCGSICHTTRRRIPEDITMITPNLAAFKVLIQ